MQTDMLQNRRLTPMLKQYLDAKAECPDAILMFRMGDFFELFFEDAKIAARELDLTLTARDKSDDPIPMAGVPQHTLQTYVARLVEKGYSVAICDQVEDPKKAKGIVKREITQWITPGTVLDIESLDPASGHYLAAAVVNDAGEFSVALLDMLAGELLCTFLKNDNWADEMRRMGVHELVVLEKDLPHFDVSLREGLPLRVQELDGRSDAERAALLCERFGSDRVEGMLIVAPELHCAMLMCLEFADKTQRRELKHVMPPKAYRVSDYVVMDEATRRNLELTISQATGKRSGSLIDHLDRCQTAMGSRLLTQWLLYPLRNMTQIELRQKSIDVLMRMRSEREELRRVLEPVRDMERLMGRVAVRRANPRDLGALRASLQKLPEVRSILKNMPFALADIWQTMDVGEDLACLLDSALLDELPTATNEGGIFKKGYRAELDEWLALCMEGHGFLTELERRERESTGISSLKVRYNRVFGYYLEVTKANLHQVPERYMRKQTLVGAERYITEELKVYEEKVLHADERRREMESDLYEDLLSSLGQDLGRLRMMSRCVAEIDALQSLAEVADEGRYACPYFESSSVLDLKQSRHPVLEKNLNIGEKFIPNDVYIDTETKQLLILTGPNMAGKSTVMRQAAICSILAHMGSFVPAESMHLGLCDRIFTRVGASDNLSRGQSTFMVEMTETSVILKHATRESLVLLDEIGRGTSTFDGLSIAWAVAEYMHDVIECRAMFATHYHELTELAREKTRICNMSMAIHEEAGRIVFLRRLVEGGSSRSYGIHVAELAGLPEAVLERAKSVLLELESQKVQPVKISVPEKKRMKVSSSLKGQLELF